MFVKAVRVVDGVFYSCPQLPLFWEVCVVSLVGVMRFWGCD